MTDDTVKRRRGRRRKVETGLPECVYLKHGAYYAVHKNKWTRLGKTIAEVNANLPKVGTRQPVGKERILAVLMEKFARTRQNAKSRGIAFNITRDDIRPMLDACGWRCAVTAAQFSDEIINRKRPFAPSIDRIDSNAGYEVANCRIVCVAANLAMNSWGDNVLKRMIQAANEMPR